MAITRCPHGHYYDDEKNVSCPQCSKESLASLTSVQQRFDFSRQGLEDSPTVSLQAFGEEEALTVQLTGQQRAGQHLDYDGEKTRAFYEEEESCLTGWLVAIKGTMRGRDYRLYTGFNRIGRRMDADVCLDDPLVSGETHCAVVYEPKKKQFYLVPGKGTATWYQDALVEESIPLQNGDTFELGGTVLELVAFCREGHTWER